MTIQSTNPASYEAFRKISIKQSQGVLTLTLDNPPVNVLDGELMKELFQFCGLMQNNQEVKVIIFQSANEQFFLAHGDINFVTNPEIFAIFNEFTQDNGLNAMQQLHLKIQQLPQITIGKLQGYMRGGGNELALSLDMRFAVKDKTWFSQPETLMGIIPGGGGTQFLTQLIGKPRSLEVILGGDLIDTGMAESYGMINRAMPKDELDVFIDRLAGRIASHLPNVAAAAKKAIYGADTNNFELENQLLGGLFVSEGAAERMLSALSKGAQTVEGEINLENMLNEIGGYSK